MSRARLAAALVVLALTVLLGAGALTLAPNSFSAPTPVASSFSASEYNNAPLFDALYSGKRSVPAADKSRAFVYLSHAIKALHAPDAWYKIGQENALLLDRRLMQVTQQKLESDLRLWEFKLGLAIEGTVNGLQSWAETRDRWQKAGRLDPSAEYTAATTGLFRAYSDLHTMIALAEQDGDRLILLVQKNPDQFAKLYAAIRTFIYTF